MDVLAVAPNHKTCDERGQNDVQNIRPEEDGDGNGYAGGSGHGAQRDVPRQQPQRGEQRPRHQRHAPVQQQNQRAAGEDALAALEAVEHGEHMPQLTAETCHQYAQFPPPEQVQKQEPADETGCQCLAHVDEDDADGVFRAVGAVEVGQSRVAAAVLAHVVLDDEVGDHDGAVETTEKVPQQQHDTGDHQHPNGG